jgi:serine/threonine-protein kinase
MEYVKGHSLRDIIEKNGYLNLKESLYIIRKVLEALKGLHNFKHKIIHRDLKPENIMISNDYTQIKIIDFGISSVIASGNKVLTLEESLYGTYAYISPEIFALNESTDKGSILNEQFDFFSIGVILYEMLLGTKPFYAEDYETKEALKLALNYDIYPMNKIDNNIPNAVENIIFKCLASKKEDKKYRYKKAEEIIHDIQKIEQNTKAAFNVKLIKPEHKRVYVARTIFKIDAEKQHLKIWYQQ